MASPLGIIIGSDVLIRLELEGVFLLVVLAGDSNHPVGAEGLSEHDAKVAQATDTDDSDSLPRTAAVSPQRRIDGDTTAEHGSSLGRGDRIGDLDNKVRRSSVIQSITTIGLASVHEGRVVSAGHVDAAVGLVARGTFLAVALSPETGFTLGADADTVSDFDISLCFGSNPDCSADDFMADAAGVIGWALHPSVLAQLHDQINQHTHPLLRVCRSDPQIPQ